MAHMNVKRSVCGVDQDLMTRTVVLVAFFHRACVPVGPVDVVLEHRQGERVRQISVVHRVSVLTVQVRVPESSGRIRVKGSRGLLL